MGNIFSKPAKPMVDGIGGTNIEIIERLLELEDGHSVQMTEEEIGVLIATAKELFLQEPTLLELESPLKICGDIHGQYTDLLRIFQLGGFPPQEKYLFLGDYVDRGRQNLETICLLLAYKVQYPNSFFMLRGNHECANINMRDGFFHEVKRRYSVELWETFNDCFNCLPLAAIVNKEIFCCHGGLSPELRSMDQIRQIERPAEVPDRGLMCDLLWADPDRTIEGWRPNTLRGVSFTFGADVVAEFLETHELGLVCRGHEVVEDGYEFFANRKLVTIFSVPNYCDVFDNAGAIMNVDVENDELVCSFQILNPLKPGIPLRDY